MSTFAHVCVASKASITEIRIPCSFAWESNERKRSRKKEMPFVFSVSSRKRESVLWSGAFSSMGSPRKYFTYRLLVAANSVSRSEWLNRNETNSALSRMIEASLACRLPHSLQVVQAAQTWHSKRTCLSVSRESAFHLSRPCTHLRLRIDLVV